MRIQWFDKHINRQPKKPGKFRAGNYFSEKLIDTKT